MGEEEKRRQCVDCQTWSAPVQSSYTLIGEAHGWRLAKGTSDDGRQTMEWRCPECWSRYREGGGRLT